jgi:uncharacterized protein (DUF4415 family)
MTKKKSSGARKWSDKDDAPELTKEFFRKAEIRDGDKIVRRGRPPLSGEAKSQVTLRLDTDVVKAYRNTGAGWQSRINADLRKARKIG